MTPLPLLFSLALAAPKEPAAEYVHGGKVVRHLKDVAGAKVVLGMADPPPEGLMDHHQDFADGLVPFQQVEGWPSLLAPLTRGDTVTAPAELCAVLTQALDASARSNELFAVVFSEPPTAVDGGLATRPHGCVANGGREVVLGKPAASSATAACTIRLKHKGLRLELLELGRAWAIDQTVQKWKSKGYQNFFVQAGSDVVLAGKVGDRRWRVNVTVPGQSEPYLRLEPNGVALSVRTEGTDPRDCKNAHAAQSAVVMEKSALSAALASPALFAGGRAAVATLKARHPALALVDSNGKPELSKELAPQLAPALPVAPDGGTLPADLTKVDLSFQ